MFDVLCERKNADEKRQLRNAALITATLINLNRGKGQKAVTIEDVIGDKQQSRAIPFEQLFPQYKRPKKGG